ncbi:uncharacterized protein FA14DRAFT_65741 [Meira miltonrushii]|uniref:Uncharacterized protein n=1 Tax=Meira miltonrushii TaxID=1280837 RepID=A0A316V8K6_9BASI|nr:uncharacterized protein FA14DRAFT_65741 [Meira miltonrushii]PWN33836.1 hypothetical protein FA14DRAFT_65741 [Meira miltonrushii]
MSSKDKAKFGKGYLTDAEEKNVFVLADDRVRFDKNGPGGAVKVKGYRGIWPVFGKPSERLGGADVIIVQDDDGATGASENTAAGTSGNRLNVPSNEGEHNPKEGLEQDSHRKAIHFAKRPIWMCSVKKACSPCEKSEFHRPYCQPYGNRALIECRKIEVTKTPERKPLPSSKEPFKPDKAAIEDPKKFGAANVPQGRDIDTIYGSSIEEMLERGDLANIAPAQASGLVARDEMFVGGHVYKGYQVCGKDRARETWDYAEFLGVNLILALIGIYVLLIRQRYLAGQHQSMLARRIGRT